MHFFGWAGLGEWVWIGGLKPTDTTNFRYRFRPPLKHRPAVFRRHFGSIQQCVHKRARVKRTQIVYAFAHADVADGNWTVGGKRGKDTAFCRAV